MKLTQKILFSIASLVLITGLGLSVAQAKNSNGNKHKNALGQIAVNISADNDDHRGNGYGHWIAPGFIKKFGAPGSQIPTNLPFGIAKKLHFWNPNINHAPFLSAITVSNITTSAATISWKTNGLATSKIEYGTTSSYGSMQTITGANLAHSIILSGLTANTTYHFKITATDADGKTRQSSDKTFTTASADITAPIVSAITISGVTANSVTLTWITNEASTSKVFYGTTSPLNTSTAAHASNTTSSTTHTQIISGLSANTTYYFVITGSDTSTNTGTSSEFSVRTSL